MHKNHSKGPRNVGVWIRVSTEDQAQGDSPFHHEQRAKEYASFNDWKVVEVYDLAGVSGKSVMEHPEAKRMLRDIKRGHISALIFSKLARLARNTKELLEFSDYFRAHDADMVSLQEKIDTSTPAGRLFYTMIAAMAQWEREEIADRIRVSVDVRAKLGKPLSGASPYGYQWKDKKLVINPAEAPIRKLAYELFLEHKRKGVVAKLLNEAGYRTRVGAKWSDIAIGRLLRCTSARGLYQFNRTRQTGSWTWEMKPESEWAVLHVEPIVSELLWQQCNQILEEQNKKNQRRGKRPVYAFAGLTFCACGQKMYVKANSPKYVCEKCRNKIPIVDLDGVFSDEIQDLFGDTAHVNKVLAEQFDSLKEKERLLEAHKADVQRVRDEMSRTYRLFQEGEITSQGFGQFYRPAEERLNQLLAQQPKLEAEIDHLRITKISAEDVAVEARTLHRKWPTLDDSSKRKIVEALVKKITVGKGEIDITLWYTPSSEELVKNQQALLLP